MHNKFVFIIPMFINLGSMINTEETKVTEDSISSIESDEDLFKEVINITKNYKSNYRIDNNRDQTDYTGLNIKIEPRDHHHKDHNDLKRSTTIEPINTEELIPKQKYVLKPTGNKTLHSCVQFESSGSSEEKACKSALVYYPYSVSIQKKGAHYASGALVSKQAVLTAAGEFYYVRESIKLFRVRMGSVDCKHKGLLMPIKSIETHPSYELGKPAFDVAVLKLARPVTTSEYITPIPLSKIRQKVISAKFLTTYWPRLIVQGKVLKKSAKERLKPHSMRVSTQKLIPWESCSKLMKLTGQDLDENSLCLKPIAIHHSTCVPDAGAPVAAEDGLWGITSGWVSEKCLLHPSPTIVTRLSKRPVREWLQYLI